MSRKLLVFQTAYTYAQMKENDILDFFTSKDLGGYFEKVITVNGFGKYTEGSCLNGMPLLIEHDHTHTYIEATNSKYKLFKRVPLFNFLFSQIRLICFLRRVLAETKVDIVRAEDPRYNGIIGFFFSSVLRIPLVVGNWGNPDTIRNLTGKPMAPRLFKSINFEKFVERNVFRNADLCIAQNTDNLDYIRQYGVSREKLGIFRLGNAINSVHFNEPGMRRKFDFAGNYGIDTSKSIFVCVSALEKRKIIEDALIVLSIVNDEKKSHLILLGSGTYESEYRQLSRNLGIEKNVTFAGLVDQFTLSEILANSNVILSPLTGRALAEGMLSATPVVAYDIDCHPDFISDGLNGYIVEYRNCQEMALKALALLNNPELSRSLGNEGRRTIKELMDPIALVKDQRLQLEKILH